MDSLIVAAARALALGDPLGALKRISLRDDAPALALRGIAMAQLGDFARAKMLLRRAVLAFGPREIVARARCVVAEAEIALAARELGWSAKALNGARTILERRGDRINAAHARCLEARRLVLLGRLTQAESALGEVDPTTVPAALRATHALIVAGIAMRRVKARAASAAIAEAQRAASEARIPALNAEIESAVALLRSPAARLIARGEERTLRLEDVEALFATSTLVVDACRYAVHGEGRKVMLAKRPVLFGLARALAESWPEDVSRDDLVARVFRLKRADESLRARLRVEIGRLRAALAPLADVTATTRGFVLAARGARNVAVMAQPGDDEHAAVLALLADGESWSSSALSLALGDSQRTVQRALESLAQAGKAQHFGYGRARRWMAPPGPGIATLLLLPAVMPTA
jgi:hypothetical protein